MAARDTDEITVKLKRGEALALLKVFEIGLRVVEALGLIQNTAAAERAKNAISGAMGPA